MLWNFYIPHAHTNSKEGKQQTSQKRMVTKCYFRRIKLGKILGSKQFLRSVDLRMGKNSSFKIFLVWNVTSCEKS